MDDLPDDIIEEFLSKLSLPDIVNAWRICTKWRQIIRSTIFQSKFLRSDSSSPKSWYLCYSKNRRYPYECRHRVYDQELETWHTFVFLPQVTPSSSLIASSSGLVCFVPLDHWDQKLYVCNPVTQRFRTIRFPERQHYIGSFALTMSVGRAPGSYVVVVVTTSIELASRLNIHVYSSEKGGWESYEDLILPIEISLSYSLSCVVCGGVLYFPFRNFYGANYLVSYDLFSRLCLDPASSLIQMPTLNERSILMNMKGKVVMVGWANHSLMIWLLDGKEWIEVATMPDDFAEVLHGSKLYSGFNETIYIQHRLSGKLVIFDMMTRHWRWAKEWPRSNPSRIVAGTYFEPRFDAVP